MTSFMDGPLRRKAAPVDYFFKWLIFCNGLQSTKLIFDWPKNRSDFRIQKSTLCFVDCQGFIGLSFRILENELMI